VSISDATKYEPLTQFLESIPEGKSSVSLSFKKIEQILGATLPRSAYSHRQWWANQRESRSRPQAHAWLSAGFSVDSVQQKTMGGAVEFRRFRL
jgi:hypothetical protein